MTPSSPICVAPMNLPKPLPTASAAGRTPSAASTASGTIAVIPVRIVMPSAQPTREVRPSQNGALSWRLRTLPEPVRGSSSAKVTDRGTL